MKNTQEKKQKESRINGGKTELYQEKPGGVFKEGNPGRPPGTRNFATDFDEVVEEIAKVNNITASEARKILLRAAYSEAKNKNFPFYKDIMDRYYGKAQDFLDVTTGGEQMNHLTDEQLTTIAERALARVSRSKKVSR